MSNEIPQEILDQLKSVGVTAADVAKAHQRLRDAQGDAVKSVTRMAMELAAQHKERIKQAAKELAAVKEKELADLRARRAAAEAEALAIRDMMSAPARVLKAPSEVAA